jgi:hypothetical protein
MNDAIVWLVLVVLIVIQVIEYFSFKASVSETRAAMRDVLDECIKTQVYAKNGLDDISRRRSTEENVIYSIEDIAHRWGVASLDDVRDIMDEHHGLTGPLNYLGGFRLYTVEAVERRLLMPNAVTLYKEMHRGDGVPSGS